MPEERWQNIKMLGTCVPEWLCQAKKLYHCRLSRLYCRNWTSLLFRPLCCVGSSLKQLTFTFNITFASWYSISNPLGPPLISATACNGQFHVSSDPSHADCIPQMHSTDLFNLHIRAFTNSSPSTYSNNGAEEAMDKYHTLILQADHSVRINGLEN